MLFSVSIAALALLASGCTDAPPQALRFGIASAPVTLDPRFATDATSARVNRLLYARLVDFNAAMEPVPALARWERLDPRHYRFTLGGDGRRFHDGSRLTARDVKATYDFVLDLANASAHRSTLAVIERIEVPDGDTIDFYLSRPDPLFPGYLVLGIAPATHVTSKHPLNQHPVGSGPFEFVGWPEEGRLLLRRLADGQVIELLRVADPTVRALKLLRGEIDMTQNDLPPELVRYLAEQEGLQVERARGSNYAYLGFNMEDPVTGRREVREAIAHALDREAIIRYVLGGAARPATSVLPPDHWAGHPGLQAYAFDPERARVLLAQAGYGPDRPVEIVYKTSSDPFRIRLATVIQSQLAAIGVRVDLRSYDWGTFYGDIKAGRFQMYSLAWIGIKTPDIYRYAFHSTSMPPEGANRGRYRNTEVDGLIEAAEQASEPEQLRAAYRAVQERIHAELPYVPLWYEDHVFVARRAIEGYRLSLDGNYDGLMTVSQGK